MSSHPHVQAHPVGDVRPSGAIGANATSRRRAVEIGFWAVLGVAFGLRVALSIALPDAHHPDEVYQAFEQAHRYAFGYGLVPWEFEIGLRSVLVPVLLAPFLRLGDALFGDPALILVPARLALAALSLLPVAAIYRAGLRRSPCHALIGGVAAATWCELVYFSYRPLTEALAADVLLTALALGSFRGPDVPRRVLIGIGACLAGMVMLRVHFAPAALVIVLALRPWRAPGRLVGLACGAAGPLALFGLVDGIAWGLPFWPQMTAIRVNVGRDAASGFGVSPAYAYLSVVAGIVSPVAPLVVAPLILRGSACRTWLLTAAAILVSHSLIPHKEYRFVFVCTAILVIAAAYASADVLTRSGTFARADPVRRAWLAGALAASWAAASLLASTTEQLRSAIAPYSAEGDAVRLLAREPDLCGILLDGVHWTTIPGYAALHRDVPIYQHDPSRPGSLPPAGAYDHVLVPSADRVPRAGFETIGCFTHPQNPGVCVLRRAGTCHPERGVTPLGDEPGLGRPWTKSQP